MIAIRAHMASSSIMATAMLEDEDCVEILAFRAVSLPESVHPHPRLHQAQVILLGDVEDPARCLQPIDPGQVKPPA